MCMLVMRFTWTCSHNSCKEPFCSCVPCDRPSWHLWLKVDVEKHSASAVSFSVFCETFTKGALWLRYSPSQFLFQIRVVWTLLQGIFNHLDVVAGPHYLHVRIGHLDLGYFNVTVSLLKVNDGFHPGLPRCPIAAAVGVLFLLHSQWGASSAGVQATTGCGGAHTEVSSIPFGTVPVTHTATTEEACQRTLADAFPLAGLVVMQVPNVNDNDSNKDFQANAWYQESEHEVIKTVALSADIQ